MPIRAEFINFLNFEKPQPSVVGGTNARDFKVNLHGKKFSFEIRTTQGDIKNSVGSHLVILD